MAKSGAHSQLLEFHNLVSAKVENQAWGHKTDDATHTDIRQEMLGKRDT